MNTCLSAPDIIGCMSALLCLCTLIMIGIQRQVWNRLSDRLNSRGLSGTIICPMLGGIIVGTIGWVLPLTIGDGNMSLPAIVSLTFNQIQHEQGNTLFPDQYMTAHLLVCSGFAKIFCLAVCMNCGFVGGFVFPLITVGAMAGSCASLLYPYQPQGLYLGCFMAGKFLTVLYRRNSLLGIVYA